MQEVLKKENIFTNCKATDKASIIKKLGELMFENGYATKKYTEAMLNKEKEMDTCLTPGLAIPHGTEDLRNEVLKTGLIVMCFPDGTPWNQGETVNLVIGIAASGDEHMQILSNVAMHCLNYQDIIKLACSDRSTIYQELNNIEN